MTHRMLAFLLVLFVGCGESRQHEPLPPASVAEWKLADKEPLTNVPEVAAKLEVASAISARYEGPFEIRAHLFAMTSDAGAFELRQKWPPNQGAGFHKGRCFVVAAGLGPPAQIVRFLNAFEKALVC